MADKPGWIVITEAIGSDANDKSGRDYRRLSDPVTNHGFTVIARLNNGYFPAGSIPAPSAYGAFAQRCANFVKASQGCGIFIIGNELNHLNEQIPGQPVTPTMYADCFNQCYAAIKAVAPDAQIVTAPVAPWDASTKYPTNPTGDWVLYFQHTLEAIASADGIGLHTYTHGAGIHLITSSARMQPPFQNRRFEFRVYWDFLDVVPSYWEHLPVYITETDQVDPWVDANTGWVQAAYAEIGHYNKTPGTQKIHCLALYRWADDKWAFSNKPGVHADLRAAVSKGYTSPVKGKEQMTTHIPVVNPGTSPAEPSLPPRQFDERLTARGVSIVTPPLKPGQQFWRIVKAQWWNEQEAQGRHHIYVEAIDPDGKPMADVPLLVTWPTGSAPGRTNGRTAFDAGNFPMSKSLNEFSVKIDAPVPSEMLKGIGMGDKGNSGIHTSTSVVFQWATMPAVAVPAPTPQPVPVTPAQPPYVPAPSQVFATPKRGIVSATKLNVRSGPGTDYPVVSQLAQGYSVTAIAMAGQLLSKWLQIGKGEWVYEKYVMLDEDMPEQPAPVAGDNWSRSRAFVKGWEGGFQDADWDAGNWTGCEQGKGIKKGTNFGISACAYPDLDIRNITIEQADAIYFRDYWQRSGADKLPWPMCLLVFDSAVNFHPDTAKKWLAESGGNMLHFVALRLRGYRKSKSWPQAHDAWVDRVIDVALEASKP